MDAMTPTLRAGGVFLATSFPRYHGFVHELVDIGVNLTHRSFANDRPAVLARARAAGVRTLILTGTSVAHSREALALAQRHPGALYSTAGIHPHDAKHGGPAALQELRELASRPEVVAVGECGLDFNRNFSPPEVQKQVFASQVELAMELGKPLFLHERDAHPAFIAVLERIARPGGSLAVPAVVHCFTGTRQALDAYLARGCSIGITGWVCDERRGRELQLLLKHIPLDRLMLETDAPFLAPRDLEPRPANGRNEPATLAHIAAVVARCMGRPLADVAAATTANARRFFGLDRAAGQTHA